jgi:hypothetical protein
MRVRNPNSQLDHLGRLQSLEASAMRTTCGVPIHALRSVRGPKLYNAEDHGNCGHY